MNTREAVAKRIRQLCREHGLTPNGLSNTAAVPQATIKSILNGESQNPGVVTIKKLCDGLEITLGEFFSTPPMSSETSTLAGSVMLPDDSLVIGLPMSLEAVMVVLVVVVTGTPVTSSTSRPGLVVLFTVGGRVRVAPAAIATLLVSFFSVMATALVLLLMLI